MVAAVRANARKQIKDIVDMELAYDKKDVREMLAGTNIPDDVVITDFTINDGQNYYGIEEKREMLEALIRLAHFDTMKLECYGWNTWNHVRVCHLVLKKWTPLQRMFRRFLYL